MNEIDPGKAQRVWSRVQAGSAAGDPLNRLLILEREAGAIYRQMGTLPGLSNCRVLARMREEHRCFLHTFHGLLALNGDQKPEPDPRYSLRGTAEGFLHRCWELRRQSLSVLASAQLPAPFTPVMDSLTRRMENHICLIPELLGALQMGHK